VLRPKSARSTFHARIKTAAYTSCVATEVGAKRLTLTARRLNPAIPNRIKTAALATEVGAQRRVGSKGREVLVGSKGREVLVALV